ncbi:hypothetical protein ANN_25549 [Periplaneta americana]|uniref:Innexin n=1 Tax=Periplaneta americana TaxID=6978 RepID=A0ABQ8S1Z1_PERAM|nr:hypothetical protein ANN_25549 [Periplaneta americana]
MFFLDKLFDGKFWSLGQDVLNYTESNSTDPVTQLFPRSGQCLYYLYGASGVMQLYSSICVLSLNVLYAKIFVFLWFWFVMLLIVTSAWIIFRLATITVPWIRRFLLYIRCGCHVQKYTIYRIVACSNVGDWFFLNMVGQNVDTVLFSDVLKDLANKLGEEKASDLEFKMSRFSNINE